MLPFFSHGIMLWLFLMDGIRRDSYGIYGNGKTDAVPDIYELIGQDKVSKTYSLPKYYISYRKPRAISVEQRKRARQMMIANNRAKED